MKLDYVGMVELVQEDDFAESALGVGGVLERIEYFLEGEGLVGFFIGYFPDMPVGSAAQLLHQGVFPKDMVLYLFAHFLYFLIIIFKFAS